MSFAERSPLNKVGIVVLILLGVIVIGIAIFFAIFAMTFGDPCGTVGPCRVYSDSVSGVTTVDPDEPISRIPFEATFSDVSLTEGEVGLEVEYSYSWAGIEPPAETTIDFETSLGTFQASASENICFEMCQGPGEMVIRWPEGQEEGSLRLRWTLRSVADFSEGPPRGAEAMLTVEAPPARGPDRLTSGGTQDPTETQYAMAAAHMNFDKLGMSSGYLRFGWPSSGEDQTQEQVLRWASGETTLRSGMAVEVPIEEVCAPGCDVDLVARWLSQPAGLLRPIVPWVEVVPSEPVEELVYGFEYIPVPSLRSDALTQSIELGAEEERTLTLTLTSPITREAPEPVALVRVDSAATGFTGESHLEVLNISVGGKDFWLNSDRDQTETPFETPIPLMCTPDACTFEVPIRLLSTSTQPVSVDLSIRINVFHPEFTDGNVQVRISE
jgi:hypothetical protein